MIKHLDIKSLLQLFPISYIEHSSDVMIIDVREAEEYEHEHIRTAINVPVSQLQKLNDPKYANKIAIFHCRSGNRTRQNEHVIEHLPFKAMYCIAGGINEWKNQKLPINNKIKAPIDVVRQMQVIVSLMILLGVLLSFLVSPYFIVLTIIAGCGLMVAGLTGFCGMISILKLMPWNRAR